MYVIFVMLLLANSGITFQTCRYHGVERLSNETYLAYTSDIVVLCMRNASGDHKFRRSVQKADNEVRERTVSGINLPTGPGQ